MAPSTRSTKRARAPSPVPSTSPLCRASADDGDLDLPPPPKRHSSTRYTKSSRLSLSASACIGSLPTTSCDVDSPAQTRGKENVPPGPEALSAAVAVRRPRGRLAASRMARRDAKREMVQEDEMPATSLPATSFPADSLSPPPTPVFFSNSSSSAPAPVAPTKSAPPSSLSSTNLYAAARSRLLCSASLSLVGRDTELQAISTFLISEDDAAPRALYVTGPPGGGKTASVRRAVEEWGGKTVSINCMSLSGSDDIWEEIVRQLGIKAGRGKGQKKDSQALVESALAESEEAIAIVLDEIDNLLSNPSLLVTLFSLSAPSKLIGIANALDLTSRSLPSHLPVQPALLHVPAYTSKQVEVILKDRLGDLAPIVLPPALKFVAAKVASATGDVRAAFSVVRHALEAVEKKESDTASLPASSSSPEDGEVLASRIRTSVKVGMQDVISALNKQCKPAGSSKTSSASSAAAVAIKTLNLHSRLALLTLVLSLRRSSLSLSPIHSPASSPTSHKPSTGAGGSLTLPAVLHSCYVRLLTSHSDLTPLPKSDFVDLLSVLSSSGLVYLPMPTPSRRGRGAEQGVRLECTEEEVLRALGLAGSGGSGDGSSVAEEAIRRIWNDEGRKMDRERTSKTRPSPGQRVEDEDILF